MGTFYQENAVCNQPPGDLRTFKTRVGGRGCLDQVGPARVAGAKEGGCSPTASPTVIESVAFLQKCLKEQALTPKQGVLPESGRTTLPQPLERKPHVF